MLGEGLELATFETYGKVTPLTVVHGISPLIFGSLSSLIFSLLSSAPTNIPTSPAGKLNTVGLDILKSHIYKCEVLFL